jgi:hypothetical protein
MDRIEVMNLVTSYQLGKISRRQFTRRAVLALGSVSLANMLLAACQAVPINAPLPTLIGTPAATAEGEEEVVPTAEATAEPAAEAASGMGEMVTYPDRDGEELMGTWHVLPATNQCRLWW